VLLDELGLAAVPARGHMLDGERAGLDRQRLRGGVEAGLDLARGLAASTASESCRLGFTAPIRR
jgi:hypothetical protein